ncbi:hypothetical protein J8281_08925 [Aquimarina sp. U1-2]|uniref:hypothetical protein n=1 Tax=Aquimarina sp. U1-2 TaxID=2823141 RepID=UPI001AEC8E68|nr:hypothetical protein [Aquimarina sp. U1-2]MBP2832308.1 hypothetical protein [Aquimarina sp. U1-2]
MFKKLIIGAFTIGCIAASCSDDDDNTLAVNAGEISGGPFEFDVDGEADFVTGISLDASNAVGTNRTWVITDEAGNILGRPGTLEMVEGVNFDDAGPGSCFIWYARFEDDSNITTAATVNEITGTFDLSNSIEVVRNQVVNAGVVSGGPFTFTVGDGVPDRVSGITLDATNAFGENRTWIITNDQGLILGLPGTLEMVEGNDFDGAGDGVCLIWYARYNGTVTGLEVGMNANTIEGDFDLSNAITVNRNQVANAGEISGGPFTFTAGDGIPDRVSGITLDTTNAFGENGTWIITDDQGIILGLPGTLEMVEANDFDGAGTGTCLIWYARYNGTVTGLQAGMNANTVEGDFDLSNAIEVVRN